MSDLALVKGWGMGQGFGDECASRFLVGGGVWRRDEFDGDAVWVSREGGEA